MVPHSQYATERQDHGRSDGPAVPQLSNKAPQISRPESCDSRASEVQMHRTEARGRSHFPGRSNAEVSRETGPGRECSFESREPQRN